MSDTRRVNIALNASGDAPQKVEKLSRHLKELAQPSERANRSFGWLRDDTSLARFTEGVGQIQDRMLNLARTTERFVGGVAALTSATTLAGIGDMVHRWADAGNRITNIAYRLNAPASHLSRLEQAGRLVGVSADTVDGSLQGLSNTLNRAYWQHDPAAQSFFRSINVDFKDAHGNIRQAIDVLPELAQKLSQYKDARQKLAVLQGAGMSPDMLVMLQNGSAGLDGLLAKVGKTGSAMTDSMAKHAQQITRDWNRVEEDFDGVANRISDKWSGTLDKMLKATSRWIEQNKKAADTAAEGGTVVAGGVAALGGARLSASFLRWLGLGFIPDAVAAAAFPVTAGAAIAGTGYAEVTAAQSVASEQQKAADLGLKAADYDPGTGIAMWYEDSSGRVYGPGEINRMWARKHPEAQAAPAPGPSSEQPSPGARHNPLNLRYAPGQQGASPTASGFGAYESNEMGIAAAERQLRLYRDRGITHLSDIISTWAPPNENDTARYLDDVEKRTGWTANQVIDVNNASQAAELIGAMAPEETSVLDPSVVARGVAMGLGRGMDAPTLAAAQIGAGKVDVHITVDAPDGSRVRADATGSGSANVSPPRVQTRMPYAGS